MRTLHDGKNLLQQNSDGTLVLDVHWGGRITRDQIAMVEAKGMVNGGEDTWFGPAEHQGEILELVKFIDQPWVSRDAERLAMQQVRGGR